MCAYQGVRIVVFRKTLSTYQIDDPLLVEITEVFFKTNDLKFPQSLQGNNYLYWSHFLIRVTGLQAVFLWNLRKWSENLFSWRDHSFRGPLHVDELKFSLGWNFIPGWILFRLYEHLKTRIFQRGLKSKAPFAVCFTSWYINENHC